MSERIPVNDDEPGDEDYGRLEIARLRRDDTQFHVSRVIDESHLANAKHELDLAERNAAISIFMDAHDGYDEQQRQENLVKISFISSQIDQIDQIYQNRREADEGVLAAMKERLVEQEEIVSRIEQKLGKVGLASYDETEE